MATSDRVHAVRFDRFGPPADVVAYGPVELPGPGRGELRIRLLMAPVNPSDLLFIRGDYAVSPRLPATPGFEGVGVVEQSGGGFLGRLLVGKRVAVLGSKTGTWATHAIAPARQVVPVGRGLPDEQAAMFFINPATAWLLTSHLLGLRRGDVLVQTAAASTVGRMVIRLGQRFGFDTINVVRREEQAISLREFGANQVLVSEGPGLAEELRRRLPNGVRHAIDPVGGAVASELANCLGSRGRLVLYGTLTPDPVSFSPRVLMTPGASISGFWLGEFMQRQSLWSKLRIVRSISRLVADGTLASERGEQFPLNEMGKAIAAAERSGRTGKVLLRCSGA